MVAETTRQESAAVMNDLALVLCNEEMASQRITAYCFAFKYSLNYSLFLSGGTHSIGCNNHVESTKQKSHC